MSIFLINGRDMPELASAFASEQIQLDHELISELEGKDELPFQLEMIRLSNGETSLVKSLDLTGLKNMWLDFQPNSLAWPFMSDKLRQIVETHLTGYEGIDWIKAVVNAGNENRSYYIPRFNKALDVLDLTKTLFVPGTSRVIKPVFSSDKVSRYALFHQPASYNLWKITSAIYCNEALKRAIEKAAITGIDFGKARVS